MRKRARNFTVMRYIVNRTPAVIALCAAFLLASCGGDDSPTGPTQGIDGARIQVTDVSVGGAAIGHCLNGTIQNTGSVTLDRHLYLTAVFHNDVGRVAQRGFGSGSPVRPRRAKAHRHPRRRSSGSKDGRTLSSSSRSTCQAATKL